jgi:hypothetical protein
VTLGGSLGSPVIAVVQPLTFSRGGTILNPTSTGTYVIWYAPFNCTVTNVKGYADTTGSVVTALHNGADLLVTDLTITLAATWQDGGAVQNTPMVTGDSLAIKIASLSGSPTQIAIEIVFTRP